MHIITNHGYLYGRNIKRKCKKISYVLVLILLMFIFLFNTIGTYYIVI